MILQITIRIPEGDSMFATEKAINSALKEAATKGARLVPNQWKALRDANGHISGKIERNDNDER